MSMSTTVNGVPLFLVVCNFEQFLSRIIRNSEGGGPNHVKKPDS